MSLRARLVGAVAGVTLVTLGGAFSAVYVAVNDSQERQLDAALRAQIVEEAADVARAGPEAIRRRPGPQANDVGPLQKFAAVYGPDGAPLAMTASLRRRAPTFASLNRRGSEPFDLWRGPHHLRALVAPVPDGSGRALLLAANRADLDGDAAFLRRAMLLVYAVALAWSALVASWVVRRLTRDNDVISSVVRRVADGDLTARVGSRSGDREAAQVGRDIDDMIERLEALVTAQRRFIAHASHELRSPLTTLLGELSHALRRARDADAYRESIEEALDATRRLKSLADDLLSLARLGAEPRPPDALVDLAAVAREATASVRAEAERRGVRVEVEAQPCAVAGRRNDLTRLARNLVDNAVRHTPRGGAVRVTAVADGPTVTLRVEDDGPGVADDERERIFEPFYRAADARDDASGAGLGLAIAREIARAHAGDVTASSSFDHRGACFVARLPRAHEASNLTDS